MEVWEHLWQFLGAWQLSETGFGRATIMVREERNIRVTFCTRTHAFLPLLTLPPPPRALTFRGLLLHDSGTPRYFARQFVAATRDGVHNDSTKATQSESTGANYPKTSAVR